MNHIATIIEQTTLRAMSRCGGLLVAICLLVMPSIVNAQSCGYYVQTKYERQMMQLRHADEVHQTHQRQLGNVSTSGDLGYGDRVLHRRLDITSIWFSAGEAFEVGTAHQSESEKTSDTKKECDGPGCRQKSAPTPPVCSCPVPKHKDQVQGVLLTQLGYASQSISYLEDFKPLFSGSTISGLFRPPQ